MRRSSRSKHCLNGFKSHRVVEGDVCDVALGDGDAPKLRVDKQEALGEEKEFP